jgi:hypothetical protein
MQKNTKILIGVIAGVFVLTLTGLFVFAKNNKKIEVEVEVEDEEKDEEESVYAVTKNGFDVMGADFVSIYEQPDIDSNIINFLPVQESVFVRDIGNGWSSVQTTEDFVLNGSRSQGYISNDNLEYLS